MERRHNKLCFQTPLLFFPRVLLEHVRSTGARHNCLNCATSHADQACHGNTSWKCVFKKNKTASLDTIFFFFFFFFNPAMSEPQRQLKFRSVFLAEKESNLLHEDSSWNVLTYPGKQAPGTKSQAAAAAAANVEDLSLFECGRKVKPSQQRRSDASKKGSRSVFPSLDVLSVHCLNSAFNFWDFSCSSVLISKVTLQLEALWGIAYT